MKILILRFSSIGDIVLTTPVIRNLKQQLGAQVHFATKASFGHLLEVNPYVDRVHLLGSDLWPLIHSLKNEKFDFIVDLHHNLRTKIVKSFVRARSASYNKLNIEKWLMVNFKINRLPAVHIVDRYMDTVRDLGVKNDGKGLDYFIPPKDEIEPEQLPPSHRQGYVAYAIGGMHGTKKLPVKRMIELCQRINGPVVLLGGKEDTGVGNEVAAAVGANIFNACGLYNLNQSASVVKNASRVFSHDTGMMHIAAAFRKEVFSIWGNTIPAFGMTPYMTAGRILENNNLSCRPCSKIGFDRCPKGHFDCMNKIKFDF